MTTREIIDWRVPAKTAWEGKESALQSEIVARSLALASNFPEIRLLHAIPNGDWRGWGTGKKLKAQGVIPGIPDLFLPVARGGAHGLYLELKRAGGTPSAAQWEIMEALHEQKYCVRVCNHLATALEIIEDYLLELP
jgi:hypothetical protein